jgi:hypothetical protein
VNPSRRYSRAAEVLRMLAGGAEPMVLDGNEDPFRTIFRLAAEACELLDAEEHDRQQALKELVGVSALLVDVHAYLHELSGAIDGGDLTAYTLAYRVKQAVARVEVHRAMAGGSPGHDGTVR